MNPDQALIDRFILAKIISR